MERFLFGAIILLAIIPAGSTCYAIASTPNPAITTLALGVGAIGAAALAWVIGWLAEKMGFDV